MQMSQHHVPVTLLTFGSSTCTSGSRSAPAPAEAEGVRSARPDWAADDAHSDRAGGPGNPMELRPMDIGGELKERSTLA